MSAAASGVNDPRYAAIVMNPITGEIYHQQNADGRRHPASLTKMMTLYLLFEALEKHELSLDGRLTVSALAARQPQTNLALDAGDSIPVETAIKALVVRSANDVAVVVGEALGGDVDSFAKMMTTKARRLGMTNTVFKNPNGLPNTEQVTTARDMAKLGIALKRDFPKYYPYFSTLQFSHNGVTYYTHNRVMLRYAGVDGIKTGFIGASGFNLVTSVVRGGRPIVATVMGGSSGRWRDDRMIQLLDAGYQIVASRGAAHGKIYPQNLPLPKNGTGKGAGVEESSLSTEIPEELAAVQKQPEAKTTADEGDEEQEQPSASVVKPSYDSSPFEGVKNESASAEITTKAATKVTKSEKPEAPTAKEPEKEPVKPAKKERVIAVKEPTVDASPSIEDTSINASAPVSALKKKAAEDAGWGIQVGAFSSHALAEQAAKRALQVASKKLVSAEVAVADPAPKANQVYRARLENLSQIQARKACELLIATKSPCFIYKVAR